jgi:hypothetical protein
MWRIRIAAAAAAIIGTAGLALLAAACSGRPSSTGSGGSSNAVGSTNSQQLAFSRCMRSQGVLNFPDPGSSGGIPKETPQQLGVTSSQFQSAQSACTHLLPSGSGGPTTVELQQSWSDMANFARCMRTHGVPNWPDPTMYPPHPERPTFDLQPVGIDPNSQQISTKIHECAPLLHGNNPQHLGEVGS